MKTRLHAGLFYSMTFIMVLVLFLQASYAQVFVTTRTVNAFLVTPAAMMNVGLMNSGLSQKIILDATLYNSGNELLLHVQSFPFNLPAGVSSSGELQIQINSVEYNQTKQAEYIKSNQLLPSGKYNLCYTILGAGSEPTTPDNCVEIVSDFNSNLYLISPADEEVIDTKYPLLIWHHTEPFEILSSNEFFRIVVVEKLKGQSAGSALSSNVPVFLKDFLVSHQVPYSIDAVGLEDGKSYSWEVQRISDNTVIQKTEPWIFSIRKRIEPPGHKYYLVAKTPGSGFYKAENQKIFFRLDEEYNNEKIDCKILDSKNKYIEVAAQNEKVNAAEDKSFILHGYNRFELDLSKYQLKNGFYKLQVVNQRNEIFSLNFYIE